MSGKRARSYEGSEITVRYDVDRCIHAAECVRGLGRVFDPDARPWVDPDGASADEIVEVVSRCPTGALSYVRPEEQSGAHPAVPTPAELSVCPDGPIYAHGEFALLTVGGAPAGRETRLALCRCGASANKPFCDNSHVEAGFEDPAEFQRDSAADPAAADVVTMTVLPNGPVLLRGSFILTGADGACEFRGDKAALCRCGESANKPFCDGAHSRVGFQTG